MTPSSPIDPASEAPEADRVREALGRLWCKAEGLDPDDLISDAGHTVLCGTLGGLDPKAMAAIDETAASLLADREALRTRAEAAEALSESWKATAEAEAEIGNERKAERLAAEADRDRLARENAGLKAALDQSWRKVVTHRFGKVCKHLVASDILSDMEKLGFVVPELLAEAVVGADDVAALAFPPLEYDAARALKSDGETDDAS